MAKLKYRRRTFIINRVQYRIIISVMGLVIGVSAILVVSLFAIFKSNIFLLVPLRVVNQVLANSILPVVVIAIILFLASLWAVVLISNKIYGPLYRLGIYIKKLSAGEKTGELKFRKGDAVDGINEIYNELSKNLEKTLHYNYKEMIHIFSELHNISDKIYNKQIQEEDLHASLQNICSRIAKALDITSEAIEPEE